MPTQTAIWHPRWFELDRSIAVGAEDDFEFFKTAPEELTKDGLPVFYFGNWNEKELYVRVRKRIVAIRHPVLGDIRKIDTRGLDYTLTMADGRVLQVNTEEEPGTVYGLEEPISIADWRIFVQIEDP